MSDLSRLFSLDAEEWLASLPDGSADCIIIDPPYESLEKHRKRGTTTRLAHSKSSSNDWFKIIPNARFEALFAQLYRVLKNNRHLYMMCDQETMFVAKPLLEAAGFKFWKPIVWDKLAMGMGYHYRARCEYVLFCEKGYRKLNDLGIPDVLNFEAVDQEDCYDLIPAKRIRFGYPTEKPVGLIKTLLSQSTQPGELIIDPCFGSGSSLIAADELGLEWMGNDLSPAAHEYFHKRRLEAANVSA